MKIECLFIVRNEQSGPELLTAWDEYTVCDNYEGWQTACSNALESVDGDYEKQRIITIEVPDDALEVALEKAEIQGKII